MRRRKIARPEWADRLESLREGLGMSQAALAKRLNVSAMAPSRWERGVHEPPADVFLELGKLAGKRDCWYFWERAGLSRRDITSVLERTPARQDSTARRNNEHKHLTVEVPASARNNTEKMVAVPVLATNRPVCAVGPTEILRDQISQLVVVPRSWCPDPEETYCLVLGTHRMAPLMRRDTIFGVHPDGSSMDDLLGKVVLATHEDCGLSVSWLQRFGKSNLLVPENKDDQPHYINNGDWKIIGRILWWFSKGP